LVSYTVKFLGGTFYKTFFNITANSTQCIFHYFNLVSNSLIGASPTVWWLIELKRSALWSVVRTYVCTRNFSNSDLNPTGLSPRTGNFENFQPYTTVIYSKFYRPFASHRLTIFHATCDEIYSSCQITNGNWNGPYHLQWSVLSPSQFYFTRFLSKFPFKFWCKARFRFDLGWIFCNSVMLLWDYEKKTLFGSFCDPALCMYVLNVLFTCSIIKPVAILLYSISEWVGEQILMQSPISIWFGLNIL
jgi:hypothetical protein